MLNGFYLLLEYEVAISISHQGIDPCMGGLFFGPYIIRLARCMAMLEGTKRMRVMGAVAYISLETLRSIWMLQCL